MIFCFIVPRQTGSLYFSHEYDATYFPEPIISVTRCTMLQCVYACLQDLRCFNVYFDEAMEGCSPCDIFSRVETTGSAPQTLKLYTVRGQIMKGR